jgi:ATP synthase protein I
MPKSSRKTDDALPPLRYELAARAEAEAQTGGGWSLRHLRICWAALGIAGVLITAVAVPVAGGRAGLGAVIGSLIVGLFFTVSAVVIARVGSRHPARVIWAALGAYVLKMIALGFVLVLTPRNGAIDTRWMAGAVGLGLAVWLAAHMRFVWTNKIFYVDPR